MPFDANRFMALLVLQGESKGISKELIDKTVAAMERIYQREHDEPEVHDPDAPDVELPPIPISHTKKCALCGKKAVMETTDKRKPCLICGFINK